MLQQKFPEDIQCILEPLRGVGGIFISNIEAAENPKTLESTPRLNQSITLVQL